jgi:hypothetical protein
MKRLGEEGWHISTSPNRWTDNKLGLEYLKTHFEPQTQETHSELGYRILIVNGHALHVTIEVIKFCVQTQDYSPLFATVFNPLPLAS